MLLFGLHPAGGAAGHSEAESVDIETKMAERFHNGKEKRPNRVRFGRKVYFMWFCFEILTLDKVLKFSTLVLFSRAASRSSNNFSTKNYFCATKFRNVRKPKYFCLFSQFFKKGGCRLKKSQKTQMSVLTSEIFEIKLEHFKFWKI